MPGAKNDSNTAHGGAPEQDELFVEAARFIIEKDKRYHKRHMALTGSNRGDRHRRDMLIDSSLLGVDGTAGLIENVAKILMEKEEASHGKEEI